jgi:hypothetical protein
MLTGVLSRLYASNQVGLTLAMWCSAAAISLFIVRLFECAALQCRDQLRQCISHIVELRKLAATCVQGRAKYRYHAAVLK